MLIDITQEVFSCRVFPGDPAPEKELVMSIERGDACNLTAFSMCAHNGTHVDAPLHFIKGADDIEGMGLDPFVGDCYVARCEGDITAEEAGNLIRRAERSRAAERILIAGQAVVTEEAAEVFAQKGVRLIGNESQTVGPEDAPAKVHQILLGAGVVLLEGIVLADVEEGNYFLCAAPLKLAGCEGAPCRAFLIKQTDKSGHPQG